MNIASPTGTVGQDGRVASRGVDGAVLSLAGAQTPRRSTALVRATRTFPDMPGQRGLATSSQLRDAGWTYSAIRHALERRWQSPFPGVFASHRGDLDRDTLLVAAALWAGPGAVLTGLVALVRLGLTVEEPGDALFLVPERARARQVQTDGRTVRVVRTGRPVITAPARLAPEHDVVLVASAARALVDAAAYQSQAAGQGEHLAIAVLQRGLCSAEELDEELGGRPRRPMRELRRGVQAFRHGAWSRPEVVLRRLVDRHDDMSAMRTNVTLVTEDGTVVGTPDGYLEEAGVVIQVHSRAHHQGLNERGGSRWAATVEKDSAYAAAGLLVVAVAPWTLYAQPDVFLRRLRRAVEQGLRRTPPALCVESRSARR